MAQKTTKKKHTYRLSLALALIFFSLAQFTPPTYALPGAARNVAGKVLKSALGAGITAAASIPLQDTIIYFRKKSENKELNNPKYTPEPWLADFVKKYFPSQNLKIVVTDPQHHEYSSGFCAKIQNIYVPENKVKELKAALESQNSHLPWHKLPWSKKEQTQVINTFLGDLGHEYGHIERKSPKKITTLTTAAGCFIVNIFNRSAATRNLVSIAGTFSSFMFFAHREERKADEYVTTAATDQKSLLLAFAAEMEKEMENKKTELANLLDYPQLGPWTKNLLKTLQPIIILIDLDTHPSCASRAKYARTRIAQLEAQEQQEKAAPAEQNTESATTTKSHNDSEQDSALQMIELFD